jgi:Uri superfamily endonuclease
MATYLLVMQGKGSLRLQVGALGELALPSGNYLYVGSARSNLEARIRRHLRTEKRRRWHIDYLLNGDTLRINEIWVGSRIEECRLANNLLALPQIAIPRRRFGSSDCRCQAHFFCYDQDLSELRQYLVSLGFSPYPTA